MKSISLNIHINQSNFFFNLIRHRLLIEAGRLSLLLRYTDLTKVILDALGNIRLKVRRNKCSNEK
jgi:hypothetical protein